MSGSGKKETDAEKDAKQLANKLGRLNSAAAIGAQMRSENGLKEAGDALESLVRQNNQGKSLPPGK